MMGKLLDGPPFSGRRWPTAEFMVPWGLKACFFIDKLGYPFYICPLHIKNPDQS
jgi:hypothetical protein